MYNIVKNSCVRYVNRTKQNYFKQKFEACRRNIKALWRILKYLMSSSIKKTDLPKLQYDDRVIHTPTGIALAFNDYFSTIASKLDREIPTINGSSFNYLENCCQNSLFVIPCTAADVFSIITSMPT